ncbi:50S ribosomal protein L24 [Granulicella tundricola]|uniref:Large ribosomal subunit protein uL24 n=1 Tax=Granulicella tundricola (strain ATCC BAA-1859 / DSM 23138 / MP5ACTX9) TaxID=1198114 RepID=E8WZJ3_GRATM|nr:50S ribosomal protein L24 [Granulicella tundricola]ADW69967.1 ribosomal protein L24 [Granulicella tundricola MP5ACTX9]
MPVRIHEKPKFKIKIKRNDQVVVIAGKDKGKKGRVLRVLADKNRILVEGVMMMKKHVKPDPQKNIKGGIAEKEATIHLSNVMLADSEGKPTRVGTRMEGDKKVRFAKTNDAVLPVKNKK